MRYLDDIALLTLQQGVLRREDYESADQEVMIESKRLPNSALAHECKTNGIHITKLLIRIPAEDVCRF